MIPKNLDAKDLIKILSKLGYSVTRQVGSHIRLTSAANGTHHVTIPNHNPLKVGTLNSIISSISEHHGISKFDLIRDYF